VTNASAKKRATQAIRHLRKGDSLTRAAKAGGTTPKTVLKYAGRRIERTATGKVIARRTDQRVRSMRFLTREGVIAVDVRGSESASRVGTYWNAMDHYLKTGDLRQLNPFKGKYLQSHGVRRFYITDPQMLERLATAGEVRFEDIYNISR